MHHNASSLTLRIQAFVATGFYIGYSPLAPASFGCLLSVIIWYFLLPYKVIYGAVTVGLFILGVVITDNLSKQWGKDPHRIVIDEYACLLFPLFLTPQRVLPLAIVFILFRILDILKPPPLRALERLPGGWGIMLDDLGAAVYTAVVLLVIMQFTNL